MVKLAWITGPIVPVHPPVGEIIRHDSKVAVKALDLLVCQVGYFKDVDVIIGKVGQKHFRYGYAFAQRAALPMALAEIQHQCYNGIPLHSFQ